MSLSVPALSVGVVAAAAVAALGMPASSPITNTANTTVLAGHRHHDDNDHNRIDHNRYDHNNNDNGDRGLIVLHDLL
jgi:hypothetical protein